LTNSATSLYTYSDIAAEGGGYVEVVPAYDDTFLYNLVKITRSGGTTQTASDATSQAAYFPRTLSKSGLLIETDNEAADAADWLLAAYKDPDLRFRRITLDPHANSALWPQILSLNLHHRITVKRHPPGGHTISQDCYIEVIEHVIVAGPNTSWRTTWNLSPAVSSSYWILGSATLSLLGSTTKLAY
jgi:hypothetical protein